MTSSSSSEAEEPPRYRIYFAECNHHHRDVVAQYVTKAAHRFAGESFYICDQCQSGGLKKEADTSYTR